MNSIKQDLQNIKINDIEKIKLPEIKMPQINIQKEAIKEIDIVKQKQLSGIDR